MKTRLFKLTFVSALFVFLVPTYGSSQADTFLMRLQGNWEGEGKVFGRAAVVQLKWEWVLASKFMRLGLRHELSAANNEKQIFEGHAYYSPQGADKFEAQWFDSRGVTFPIKAHVEGNTLISFWGSPEKEEGKTIYHLIDDARLRVVDAVKQKDGTFREFSSATLKRQDVSVATVLEFVPLQTMSDKRYAARSNLRSIRSAQAEQTVKNIQVLKGLPESQLFLVMNFVATSLGVHCNFCHVQQGKDPKTGVTKWVWEIDDKPEKRTARGMMQMVLAIKASDKVDFRGNEVTCYTCHRGQRKPVGIPDMPLTRSGHEGPDDAAPTERTALPSVEQIFIKYMEALGGSAATNTRTLVLKGKREASQNRNWPNEITLAAPDRFLLVATMPQATVRQIVNGDKGWIVNGTNVRNLTAANALEAGRSYDELFNVIKVKPSQNMRLVGTRKVGERDAYMIENATDTKIERFYFDSQTGLLLRKMALRKTMLMPFPEQIDFEDYRDVDGVKVPFTIRYSAIDTYDSWTRTFTEIKRNAVLSDSLFAAPTLRQIERGSK